MKIGKILILISYCVIITICIGCVSFKNGINRADPDKVTAENVLLKRQVTLLERDNQIYKSENLDYSRKLKEKEAALEKSEANAVAQQDYYNRQLDILKKQYEELAARSAILSNESSNKIRELTELNNATEGRLNVEIKRLNDLVRSREENYNREREELKKDIALREHNYQTEVDKAVADRNNAIAVIEDYKKNMEILKNNNALLEQELSRLNVKIAELEGKLSSTHQNSVDGVKPVE